MDAVHVSIDIETTGLSPELDAILEIGLVRFSGSKVVDEWSSLVNPRRRVPIEITELTGITQRDVDRAPVLGEIRQAIKDRLAAHPLVAHNASFDVAFLDRNGIYAGNPVIDTLELATILYPAAGQYGLQAISRQLGLIQPGDPPAHRGLADAKLTARLFERLVERAASLPIATLEEIVEAGAAVDWPPGAFLEQVLKSRIRHALTDAGYTARHPSRSPLFQAPRRGWQPLEPIDPPVPIDAEEIAPLLSPDGLFDRYFPAFEYRPQQVDMAHAVANALSDSHHLMVEAGTGTGKSIAYLLPAAHWAAQNQQRVIVSTNTINLQDQLIGKDIPDLQKILPFEFHATVVKGRSNYVCPRMVDALRRTGPSTRDELRLLAKILIWLPESGTGERGELSLGGFGERLAWSRLNADNDICTGDACAVAVWNCPLNAARLASERAHLVIVNHALLLSDIVTGNRVLPEFRYLIVDEAHHLENATTNGLSFRLDEQLLARRLTELTHSRGLVMDILGRCRAVLPAEVLASVEGPIYALQSAALAGRQDADTFFLKLGDVLEEHTGGQARAYSARLLVTDALRKQPAWEDVEIAWEHVSEKLHLITERLKQVDLFLDEITESFDLPDGEDLALSARALQREIREIKGNVDDLVFSSEQETIYWIEQSPGGDRTTLHSAPLHVGPLVERHLFHQKDCVILTSATLQTSSPSSEGRSGFDYLRERLHAVEADELAVGSPFDYETSTLLFLPTDMPEPRQPGYQRLVEESLMALARAIGGRTLVLFTAYNQLRQTAQAIRGALGDAGIGLLVQGSTASRRQLLDRFRSASASVLLGTRSFWEGVDIPGPALSCVVIVKLPFDVPSDPVFAARQQTFENPFYEYAVPEAVLRFRQGFGRLIRSHSDRGIVACFDKRILTKAYGRFFIEALPPCKVERAGIASLPKLASDWLRAN